MFSTSALHPRRSEKAHQRIPQGCARQLTTTAAGTQIDALRSALREGAIAAPSCSVARLCLGPIPRSRPSLFSIVPQARTFMQPKPGTLGAPAEPQRDTHTHSPKQDLEAGPTTNGAVHVHVRAHVQLTCMHSSIRFACSSHPMGHGHCSTSGLRRTCSSNSTSRARLS